MALIGCIGGTRAIAAECAAGVLVDLDVAAAVAAPVHDDLSTSSRG